jgi:hypothetical protein
MTPPTTTCERCQSWLEKGDLRCAICGQAAALETERRVEIEIEVLRCDGCGAGVTYDAEVQAPLCAFCGSVTRLESLEDPMEQTESFLPFTVEPSSASAALRRWLSGLGWFRPSDLKSAARMEALQPLWWVCWAFDATALVSWTADSNYGSGRSDWAPFSGQTEMVFDDIVVSASRGLTDDETSVLSPLYDLSTAQPSPGRQGTGTIEHFDVQRSLARARIAEHIGSVADSRLVEGVIPGSSHRNVHVAPRVRKLVTRRLAMPAYVLAYRYGDKLYRAVICGQNSHCVLGSAPYSWVKILGLSAVFLAAAAALAYILA